MPFVRRSAPSQRELIALIAMMFATIAFSIDAMLPALPNIGAALSPENPNRAQLIIALFILGMGIGTFFTGPLSDAFGRKSILMLGIALYATAALIAYVSLSLEMILVTRVIMGIGAAAPRVVGVAIVRDLYAGRDMARIMSFVMMIFALVPAFAPLLGTVIIALADWHAIFLAFALFGAVIALWAGIRLPEPLPAEERRPLKLSLIIDALKEMAANPTVRISIWAQCLTLSMLFTMIVLVQPVYDIVFDKAESFPIWFMIIALLSMSASFINSRIVVRLGMRKVVTWSLLGQACVSGVMLLILFTDLGALTFYPFLVWQLSIFLIVGLTLGNLNSIALEPLGHIAGIAASVIGAVSTVFSATVGAIIGQMFNGTLFPMVIGIFCAVVLAFLTMLWLDRAERVLNA